MEPNSDNCLPSVQERESKQRRAGHFLKLHFLCRSAETSFHWHGTCCSFILIVILLSLTHQENQVTPPRSNLYPTILSHSESAYVCPKALLAQLLSRIPTTVQNIPVVENQHPQIIMSLHHNYGTTNSSMQQQQQHQFPSCHQPPASSINVSPPSQEQEQHTGSKTAGGHAQRQTASTAAPKQQVTIMYHNSLCAQSHHPTTPSSMYNNKDKQQPSEAPANEESTNNNNNSSGNNEVQWFIYQPSNQPKNATRNIAGSNYSLVKTATTTTTTGSTSTTSTTNNNNKPRKRSNSSNSSCSLTAAAAQMQSRMRYSPPLARRRNSHAGTRSTTTQTASGSGGMGNSTGVAGSTSPQPSPPASPLLSTRRAMMATATGSNTLSVPTTTATQQQPHNNYLFSVPPQPQYPCFSQVAHDEQSSSHQLLVVTNQLNGRSHSETNGTAAETESSGTDFDYKFDQLKASDHFSTAFPNMVIVVRFIHK